MDNMMKFKEKTLAGSLITTKEALTLYDAPLENLCKAANEIRVHFCGNVFDICAIINGKNGRCTEDCKYCAQSAFYRTDIKTYSLLSTDEILAQAKHCDKHGVLRYSIVTSGKALNDEELDLVCESVRVIKKQTGISVCVSLGLLNEEQFRRLKDTGVTRVHSNLETSRNNFPNVCTTHSYDEKIAAIRSAQRAGINVCSGGIMGLGETPEDRIDMALTLRKLGVRSVPVNMLNPIPGTPYENNSHLTNDDMCRIVAVYRFLLPNASIRLAGGRGLLPDKGRACFVSGANAAISGDMLTTAGISIVTDMKMLKELGYKVAGI
jgi:biotin synthase